MDWLENLSLKWVLMAVGCLVLLHGASRLSSSRRPQPGALAENLQGLLTIVVVVFLVIRPFLFQAFYIPSDSMAPTLLGPRVSQGPTTGGDRLVVNKLVYRVSDPQRFDIAVFRAPASVAADEREFIKRIVGLPGDTVEAIPGRILVDGRTALRLTADRAVPGWPVDPDVPPAVAVKGPEVELPPPYPGARVRLVTSAAGALHFDGRSVRIGGRRYLSEEEGRVKGRIEGRAGLADHGGDPAVAGTVFTVNGEPRLFYVSGQQVEYDPGHLRVNGRRVQESYLAAPPGYALAPTRLGADQYFMLGDNRNNSNDSHEWGPLPRERLVGRAEILFWPLQRFSIMQWWLLGALAGLLVGYQVLSRALQTR